VQRWMAPLLLAAAMLASGSAPSIADAVADCNASPDPQLQIRACSIVIDDGATSAANRAVALGNRGNAFGMLRRSREALADYAAAIAIDPDDPLTFYNRGNVLFDLGRLKEAIRDYTRATELHDAFALAYYNRGLAREKLGDLTGATEDYRIVESLDDPVAAKAKARREKLGGRRPAHRGAGTGN